MSKLRRRLAKKYEKRARAIEEAWFDERGLRWLPWFGVSESRDGRGWMIHGGSAVGLARWGRTRGEAVVKFERTINGRHRDRVWGRAYRRDEAKMRARGLEMKRP